MVRTPADVHTVKPRAWIQVQMHLRNMPQIRHKLSSGDHITIHKGCRSGCKHRVTIVQSDVDRIMRFCCCGRASDTWDSEVSEWRHMLAYDLWQLADALQDVRRFTESLLHCKIDANDV